MHNYSASTFYDYAAPQEQDLELIQFYEREFQSFGNEYHQLPPEAKRDFHRFMRWFTYLKHRIYIHRDRLKFYEPQDVARLVRVMGKLFKGAKTVIGHHKNAPKLASV